MNYPRGKEKAGDERGQKVLVGGGNRTEQEVRTWRCQVDDAPLTTQPERERCETSSSSSVTPSMSLREAGCPQTPAEATAVAAQDRESARAVFALTLARQTGPARKDQGADGS